MPPLPLPFSDLAASWIEVHFLICFFQPRITPLAFELRCQIRQMLPTFLMFA